MADLPIALLAILAGIIAATVIAFRIAKAEQRRSGDDDPALNTTGLAAGILREIAILGGASTARANELAKSRTDWEAIPDERIDLTSWAEAFAEARSGDDRAALLESAVAVAVATGQPMPAVQYSALMSLTFALGFHTDALARLRETYAFEHDDWARIGRPEEADRGSGGATLFRRPDGVNIEASLAVLGLDESRADRQMIVSAYRHLAAEWHPDRFHDASPEDRAKAASRFREISAAYQLLLQVWDRD